MNIPMISVSILSADFGNLKEQIEAINVSGADMLHLDIMDGHYVPNLTFGSPLLKPIAEHSKIPLDAHLMVTNPEDYIDKFAELGISFFSFHQETVYHSHRTVQRIKQAGMKAGIALNPSTPVSSVEELIDDLDFVLLMSVNPGYSGQSFLSTSICKLKRLKTLIEDKGSKAFIEVDGGVTNSNSSLLVESGADVLVTASYVFSHKDYRFAINQLRSS